MRNNMSITAVPRYTGQDLSAIEVYADDTHIATYSADDIRSSDIPTRLAASEVHIVALTAELDEVRELLRQHQMDWGKCDHPTTCPCSDGRSRRYLLEHGEIGD